MKKINYTYSRERFMSGYDGTYCKVCPNIVVGDKGVAYLVYKMLLLTGSDVYSDYYAAKSVDGGKTFGEPKLRRNLDTYTDGIRTTYDMDLMYNKYHKVWFGLGRTTHYEHENHPMMKNGISFGELIAFSFNPETGDWGEKLQIEFPIETISVTPMPQIIEYDNGDMLIPFYYKTKDAKTCSVVTVLYRYTENGFKVLEVGEPISGDKYTRGLLEPALAYLNGVYYLTLRSDEVGLWAYSRDGLHFSEPQPWRWDDNSVLENYNTMQHWICHKDGLFLAYTRRGAHNDHVFRHRAPLFMARFDEDRQCLIRDEEVILVPELGARLGNFNVIEASEKESWLITAEWMQLLGCEKYGSDNSFWRAHIIWE